ncbi:MAG: NAD(P)/FAD-dependent oxidoreductase [Actinomycetota bacterium]
MDEVVDAVVVGGGPSGLAAATWLARYRRTVVVLDSAEYRNRWVERMHGYLGLDPEDPAELLRRARAALERYPTVRIAATRATAIAGEAGRFRVETTDATLTARRLVLATGVEDEFPDIPGFFDHYGADVFHCPACDGYEAKERAVAAIGWDEHVTGFARGLLEWARRVTVVTEGRSFRGDAANRRELAGAAIDIREEAVDGFLGERGALRGLVLEGGEELECELAFFSIAHHPRTELARGLGCELDGEGYVRVDECGRTSVEGVLAVGDLTPGDQLVQVAAAKGAVAGVACAKALSERLEDPE